MFDLRTLGTLDLRVRDGPELLSVLSQPKRTALLCYLALAAPRGFHRRDSLLALFWPEADAEHAHASLRQAVHFLRRSLGEDVIRARGDDDLALGNDVVACDAVEFEEALAAGEQERALALYRGDLLPGFYVEGAPDFERWLEGERTRLRGSAVAAAWALAEARERAGDAAGAAEWARAALALAPDDAAVRRLMRALERLGDREGALAAYESWARRLRAEYEIEPSAEARGLAEQIRARGATPGARVATAAPATAGRATAPPPASGPTVLPSAPLEPAPGTAKAASAEPTTAPAPTVMGQRHRRWLIAAGITVVSLAALEGLALRRAHRAPPAAGAADVASVAVLPFADLSPGHDQAYFADGVTEELISLLAQVPGLRVPGRTSSFYFQDKQVPVQEIARQLGVRHILEGSARKVESDVRVRVQFTDALTGRQLWSRSFGAHGADVVALEQEVARQVASSLLPRVADFPSRAPRIPEAYDLYLQGLYTSGQEWMNPSQTRMARTLDLFRRALDLDPGFGPAWAGLAQAYYRKGDFPRAKAAAARALELDSTLVMGRTALAGSLYQGEWRWAEAERLLDRAIELAPSSALAYWARASLRVILGRYDEAFADLDRAAQLDPLNLEMPLDRGKLAGWADRPAEALRALERVPHGDSGAVARTVIDLLAATHRRLGHTAESERLFLSIGDTFGAVVTRANRAAMLAWVNRLEVDGKCLPGRAPGPLIVLYGRLGMDERAMDCLEEVVNAHDRWVGFLLRGVGNDSAVSPNPRYRRLMQRVGLPILPPTSRFAAPR